jgi:hypothetical protein
MKTDLKGIPTKELAAELVRRVEHAETVLHLVREFPLDSPKASEATTPRYRVQRRKKLTQGQVLGVFNGAPLSTPQVRRALGTGTATSVVTHLSRLVKAGHLERIGTGRPGVYARKGKAAS